jgi:cystathionine beta-lyase family protein involved in aluminum resistance
LTIEKIEEVIKSIREVNKEVIIMVDNCYGEFVQDREPIEVGADVVVGSLMKNLGAGMATTGAYIVGNKDLIKLCSERFTAPGVGKEIGPSLNQNTNLIKGMFFAPSVVASSVKTAVFSSCILEKLGYDVDPKFNEIRADIVQTIKLGSEEKLIKFCQGIQKGSPIDSNVLPFPSEMGGYDDKVIMAAGTFTQGSTIELSCDGPIREPFIAYMQGGLTYEYGKYGILKAIEEMDK